MVSASVPGWRRCAACRPCWWADRSPVRANVVAGLTVRVVSADGVAAGHPARGAGAGVHRLEGHGQVGIDRDPRRVRRRGRRRHRWCRSSRGPSSAWRGGAAAREAPCFTDRYRAVPRRRAARALSEALDDDAEARLGQPELHVADVDVKPLVGISRVDDAPVSGISVSRTWPGVVVVLPISTLFARRAAAVRPSESPRRARSSCSQAPMPFVPGPVPPPHRARRASAASSSP